MSKNTDRSRLTVTLNPEILEYLDDVAKTGLYGKTRPEVAKSLISREIERLIRENIITLNVKD